MRDTLPTSAGVSPPVVASRAGGRRSALDARGRVTLSPLAAVLLLAGAAVAGVLMGRVMSNGVGRASAVVPQGTGVARGGGGTSSLTAGHVSGAFAVPGTAGKKLPKLFLFVGVLSGRGYRHRRLAVRESWVGAAQLPPVSLCRFILSEDEVTPQVRVLGDSEPGEEGRGGGGGGAPG